MTEVRMRLRQKGQQFPTQDLEAFLLAFGDNDYPLPETVRVLDEIITDYIIETCHEAASVAHHARRAKIKLDDFKFMLRRDTVKLGRVSDMLETDKELKRKRKAFDTDEGAVLAKDGDEVDGAAAAKETEKPKKRGVDEDGEPKKKRKKKDKAARVDGGGDDASTSAKATPTTIKRKTPSPAASNILKEEPYFLSVEDFLARPPVSRPFPDP